MGKFWVRFLPLHAGSCFMEGSLHGVVIRVRIDVQRDAGVGMPHEILQTFHVDPGLLHVGAKGMPQHMMRDGGERRQAGECVFLRPQPRAGKGAEGEPHFHWKLYRIIR